MKRTNLFERGPQMVICLDSAPGLWKRVQRTVNDQDRWEVRIVRAAHAAADIASLCRLATPALLMTEESMLDLVPFRGLADLISRRELRILVFSGNTDESSYESLFRQGCAGVLPVDTTDRTVYRAMQAVYDGELWLPRRVLSKLALSGAGQATGRELTRRESEILAQIRSGLSNQQIAERLFISRETVRWHIRNLNSKTGDVKRIGVARTK